MLMSDYIFGYGSPISTESRNSSGETLECCEARANDLKREWNLAVPKYEQRGIIGLGAVVSPRHTCNGVLFKCKNINDYIKREEKYGYKKVALWRKDLELMQYDTTDIIPPIHPRKNPVILALSDNIWYFSPFKTSLPSKETPIRQSYLDICIMGCLEYSLDFAIEFIRTTNNWAYWTNDRKNPVFPDKIKKIYPGLIDDLLKQVIPDAFSKRINEEYI